VLDTARLRYALGQKLRTSPKNVHAYVVGEHGDSEFVAWSSANFSLQKVADILAQTDRDKIEDMVKNAAYKIINKKGATHYGIGMCMAHITAAILGDENAVLPVSNYHEPTGVFVGMPAKVGRTGVKERLPIELNAKEHRLLDKSLEIIHSAVKSVLE
jgi:L-lactate dehydrogenase